MTPGANEVRSETDQLIAQFDLGWVRGLRLPMGCGWSARVIKSQATVSSARSR